MPETVTPARVLTIREPWIGLILSGRKTVEFRTAPMPYRSDQDDPRPTKREGNKAIRGRVQVAYDALCAHMADPVHAYGAGLTMTAANMWVRGMLAIALLDEALLQQRIRRR